MKRIVLISMVLLFASMTFAQAPEKMSYQAVARDLSGLPIANTVVSLQFDILQGSATGPVTYSEAQSKTTNQFGLFTAEIGGGTILSGSFPGLAWGTNSYYLRITVDGDQMPATELLSVPYALYSKASGVSGNALSPGAGINIGGGVISAIDTSITNEIQILSINATSDTLFLSDGGTVYLPPAAGLIAGNGINITGSTITSTLDTSVTNEIQDLSWNNLDSNIIDLSGGTGVPLASNTPVANQVLTWNGTSWIAQTLPASPWTKTGDYVYPTALTDSIGIGTTNPKSMLQLGNYSHLSPIENGANEKYTGLGHNAYWDGTPSPTATLRNTTGGISAASIMGDDNGTPMMTWLLFPAQPAGTDMFGVTPDLRMNLRGLGLAINSDNASASLEVGSIDSASIFIDVPDDNSQPTLSYRAPGGAQDILGLRVPNSLTNSYTLTYPIDLPGTGGSSLVSDLSGNLSWSPQPAASPWTGSLNLIYPTNLMDKVGIGLSSPAAKLDVLSTTTDNSPITTQIVNQNNTAGTFSSLYVSAQSSGTASEYRAAQFQSIGPGATGNSIGIKASATGGATNWAAYFEAGNVYIQNNMGIGTLTPANKLDIEGGLAVGTLYSGTNTAPANGMIVQGNVGIGTNSPHASGNFTVESQASRFVAFDVTGGSGVVLAGGWLSATLNPQVRYSGVSAGFIDIGQNASGNFVVEGNDTPHLTVMQAGNVGIGTTTPSDRLTVTGGRVVITTTNDANGASGSGVLEIGNNLRIDENEIITNAGTILSLQHDNNGDLNVSNGALFVNGSTNRVGIGTNAPSALLHTSSTASKALRLESSSNIGTWLEFRNSSVGGEVFSIINTGLSNGEGAGKLIFTRNASFGLTAGTIMTFEHSTSNVGIGTTAPTERLEVNGNIRLSGANREINKTETGTANLLPIAYGNVSTTGAINAGSGNFTVNRTGAGQYLITVTGQTLSATNCVVSINTQNSNPRFVGYGNSAGGIYVFIRDNASAFIDNNFSFTIFRP